MWTSSDHYLAPPPQPGGRGRLWSALLLLAVGVVTLAVLAVVAIAVVLGGYQKPRELQQGGPPKRVAPSTTWGEDVQDEQLPSRMHTQQRLYTPAKHLPVETVSTTTTTSTISTISTTTSSSISTTRSPKLPTYRVQGTLDFEQKHQQQRDWARGESSDRQWRLGEAAVVQDPADLPLQLVPETPPHLLPARSYIGIKGDRVMPTLFPPTEAPRLVGTSDIPAFDLGMLDSISKSFTHLAIRVRPQHPLQPPIVRFPSSPTPKTMYESGVVGTAENNSTDSAVTIQNNATNSSSIPVVASEYSNPKSDPIPNFVTVPTLASESSASSEEPVLPIVASKSNVSHWNPIHGIASESSVTNSSPISAVVSESDVTDHDSAIVPESSGFPNLDHVSAITTSESSGFPNLDRVSTITTSESSGLPNLDRVSAITTSESSGLPNLDRVSAITGSESSGFPNLDRVSAITASENSRLYPVPLLTVTAYATNLPPDELVTNPDITMSSETTVMDSNSDTLKPENKTFSSSESIPVIEAASSESRSINSDPIMEVSESNNDPNPASNMTDFTDLENFQEDSSVSTLQTVDATISDTESDETSMITEVADDVTASYIDVDAVYETTVEEIEVETTTEDLDETMTTQNQEFDVNSSPVMTPVPTAQQQHMTSRAAVERTAKQDPLGTSTQHVQREAKGSLLDAFPSSEFNNAPAFLRNKKRNVTTTSTTTTEKARTETAANCSCAARLKAQGLSRKICDGVLDCWDYSDEERCEWCALGRHVCAHSRACVPKSKLCDGKRDCPFGDDERNCVSVAPDRKRADALEYNESGLLMVQKAGIWGTLCVEKLEGTAWRLGDVARAVCRALSYGDFERAEQVQVPGYSGPYYELNLQNARHGGSSPNGTPRLAVESSECPSRAAVRLGCRDLQCGMRPLAGSQWASSPPRRRGSRIVGGGNAGPGAWPWQAALYKEGQFQCGGSLISAQWLLSASHCFAHNLDAYWVARLGALRRGTDLASPFEQLRRVIRIVQHPGYLDHGFVNDLALLRLERPVQFSDYIRPVCLPSPDAEEPGPEGQMCTVVGWGQLSEVGRIFPDTLQEVQLPLISTEECRKRTLFLPLYRVTEDMFCAGFERGGRDACLGDSGGPLMCQSPDARWELTGITSNGYGCARANRPGVYTKVANYVRWIGQVIDSDRSDNFSAPACPEGQQRCALGQCSAPSDGSCGKLYCPAA